MARKNDNAKPKPKVRSRPVKPKKSKTDRPGGKRPRTPAEEEVVVSRITMIRHTGRGGRGR